MRIGISALMWWFFSLLLSAAVKLGLDRWLSIASSDLWGSLMTSVVGFATGFGIVGFFRRHEAKKIIVGGAK